MRVSSPEELTTHPPSANPDHSSSSPDIPLSRMQLIRAALYTPPPQMQLILQLLTHPPAQIQNIRAALSTFRSACAYLVHGREGSSSWTEGETAVGSSFGRPRAALAAARREGSNEGYRRGFRAQCDDPLGSRGACSGIGIGEGKRLKSPFPARPSSTWDGLHKVGRWYD